MQLCRWRSGAALADACVCVCVFTAEQMLHYTHQSALHRHPLLLLLLFVKCHHCYCACSYQTTSTENATASPAPPHPRACFSVIPHYPAVCTQNLYSENSEKGESQQENLATRGGFLFLCVRRCKKSDAQSGSFTSCQQEENWLRSEVQFTVTCALVLI